MSQLISKRLGGGLVATAASSTEPPTSARQGALLWMKRSSSRNSSSQACRGGTASLSTQQLQPLHHKNNNHNHHHQLQHRRAGHYCSLNQETPYNLCFLRHGQSTWNRDNRFIGWTDTPLTDVGVLEARVAGQMLKRSGILFDEVHTSLLRRSIRTTNLVLMELGQEYLPVYKHWRLNERNYGDLVGKNKKEVVLQHGKDQVKRWRRSYDEPPPPMADDHPFHPARDPRYGQMLSDIPLTESLKDTKDRSRVYWNEVLAPALQQGKTVLVVGHENNLRSLLMCLEDIAPQDIIHLNLPRAVPLAYRLDDNLQPLNHRPDGQLDEATGFLRGEWLGGDRAVKEILSRDYKQVYDTSITRNLETGTRMDRWREWMEFVLGKPNSPYQQTLGTSDAGHCEDAYNSLANSPPVPGADRKSVV